MLSTAAAGMDLTEPDSCGNMMLILHKHYICVHPGCDAKFSTPAKLKKHGIFHLNVRPYVCTNEDGCTKSFFTLAHLERHMKSHEKTPSLKKEPKVYNCTYCEAKFKHKFNLRLHEAVHTGAKPLKCDKCDASFALKGRLKKHMKTHLGYPCKECDFKAEHWSGLRKHMVQHRQKCPKCNKGFAMSATLEAHMKKHEEVFSCPHCHRKYNRNSNLQAHIKAKHEQVHHVCSECGKEFAFKQSLVNHQKREHNENEPREPKSNKPSVVKKRKLAAVLLSGCDEISPEDKEQLLEKDKLFRLENPEYNKF